MRDIAIIGIGAKLPQAEDYNQFWANLISGRDSIRELPQSRGKLNPEYDEHTEYAPLGYIEEIDHFDPEFFRILPSSAKYIDPAQRLMLEMVNNAIEDAGYAKEQLSNRKVGVFLGDIHPEYYQYIGEDGLDTLAGNLPANLAGRVSYVFGFTGPALTIDTACSSGLVSLHLAIESIRNGDSEMAIVGGANIQIGLSPKVEGSLGIVSPTGKCRSFSKDADGTISGEGVIAFLLKPLAQAVADRDQIHAVIKGSAVNQDGSRSNGLTAPSPVAQKEVIQAAWQNAGVDPLTISYIEAHGSATPLGDPIEVTGLTKAFADVTSEKRFCPLGAVKTNIGHLGSVAGLAGLLKTVLSLKHKKIPPIVNFSGPNPYIDFASAPVFVNTELQEWSHASQHPRRAGVSSFGLSGTNCHVIVEEANADIAPELTKGEPERYHMIGISGPTPKILQQKLTDLKAYLQNHPEKSMADISFTLNTGRKHYAAYRCGIAAKEPGELLHKLAAVEPESPEKRLHEVSAIFLLPDYQEAYSDFLMDFIHSDVPDPKMAAECIRMIGQNDNPQVAFFMFEYLLAQFWISLGIKPQSMIGTGVGQTVAAVLLNKLTLAEGIREVTSAKPKKEFDVATLGKFIDSQLAKGRNLFIHLADQSILADEVKKCIGARENILFCDSYGHEPGAYTLMCVLANFYQHGLDLNLAAASTGRRISLPPYPYEKESYWFDLNTERVVNKKKRESSHAGLALPDERYAQLDVSPYRTPEGILENLLAIWQQCLGFKEIVFDDDFIELGGDSIRGMLLINEINKCFHVSLDIACLLQYGTINALAKLIREELDSVEDQQSEDVLAVAKTDESLSILQANPRFTKGDIQYYDVSPSQKNLWLVHQFDPNEIAYNEPMAIKLKGSLNCDCLHRALQTMVKRQGSLRTFFELIEDQPMQGVHAPADELGIGKIDYVDISGSSYDDLLLERLVHEEAKIPFDLSHTPLFRAKLIKLHENEHLLIIVIHHIIFDGWSIMIFLREICQLYEAYVTGLANPLTDLTIQYHDFAHWQNQLMQAGQFQEAEDYWVNKLAGELPILNLPTDYPRPAEKSYEGSSIIFDIPKDVSDQVKMLSKKSGATLFATMLTFFEILLYKYTHQEEFVIGTPSANRPNDQLWNLIGFFVNTFALRHQVMREDSYVSLMERVKKDLLESYRYKDYPFTELVSKLNLHRDLSRSAVFDVMYVFHNVGSIEKDEDKNVGSYGGLTFEHVSKREIVSDYDLKIEFAEGEEQFQGKIEYSTLLFTQETIERMAAHFHQIIREVAHHPEKQLQEISILTEAEKDKLLYEFNATKADFADNQTIDRLFAEQVKRTPANLAVLADHQQLTYQELDERSNQLASVLRKKGVTQDRIVGIMVERSIAMMIGIFGIIKAGGAYLPIDPSFPEDRIRFMLQDSQAKLVLVHSQTVTHHAAEIEQINLDDDNLFSQEPLIDIQSVNKPHDLIYVIYTSGSTGKPKGTMIEHISLINRLQWMQKQFPLDESDTILHKTPFIFDVSVWEIFWWSLYGAKLFLLAAGDEKEPQRIMEAIDEQKVTTMHFIPSMLNAFLEYVTARPAEIHKLRNLRQVFASGEALKKNTVLRFNELLNNAYHVRLYNLYGPTEAAIDVSSFDCLHEIHSEIVPIGRPIDNIQLYVVDDNMELAPIGLPGEICIAGVGLARGYLNLPELTWEKFVTNPFQGPSNERMYRTGDLGRYRSDGNIEFLGRMDHQVKIRGFRIELGEIEATLIAHPAVQEAVVLMKEAETGDKKLIGYIVSNHQLNPEELRQHMLQHLPEYMIPLHFIFIEKLPQLPNGKIDRKALLKMDVSNKVTSSSTLPRNELEAKLVGIWAKILHIKEVGIYDKFFELGGDSIKAIQVVSEMNKLGFNLKVKDLMKHQTIHQIMTDRFAYIQERDPDKKADQFVEGQMPLTPIQQWFFRQGYARPNHWNHSLLLQLQPEIDLQILNQAFQKVFEHHDALRLIYHPQTGTLFYHNLALEAGFELVEFDLSSFSETEKDQKIAELGFELKAGFALEAGPLMRVGVFHLGERGRRLLMTIHHLVIDGVSWRILFQDLQEAYEQLASGQEASLPPKTTSYKDWAYRLVKYSKHPELHKEIPYWEEIIKAEHSLPYDHDCGEQRIFADDQIKGELSIEATKALLTEVHHAYNTNMNEILLTALMMTLQDWTGQHEHVIDLEGHGREELFADVDLNRTVGWFTAIYPAKLRISEPREIGYSIKEIKEELRMIPHGGIGYGILRYLANALAEPDQDQPNRITFNYLGQFDSELVKSIFTPATEMSGADISSENQRTSLLEVIGCIVEGKLQIAISYSQNRYRDETIAKLLMNYLAHLRAIISFCTSGENIGYTPSDFEMVDFNQNELDDITEEVESLLDSMDLDIDLDLEI